MTFDETNNRWNAIVGKKRLNKADLEMMKKFFFKLGESEGIKRVGRETGLGKSSWDTNPDRSGGQFSKEEINDTGWK